MNKRMQVPGEARGVDCPEAGVACSPEIPLTYVSSPYALILRHFPSSWFSVVTV